MKHLYLLVNVLTVIVPFLFSFHPKTNFYRTWKAYLPATIVVAILFAIWDSQFTRMGVWGFNPRYVTGIYIFNLPIEEILFFICIPYACVFTFYCLNKFYNLSWRPGTENIFCTLLCSCLMLTGFIYYDRLYTSVTFISTAVICLLLKFIFRIDWFGKLISVYAVLLIPFFIVNGILTGTGPDEAVVVYNNAETLGIRLLTIPVEDVIYGFELVLLNVFLWQLFEKKFKFDRK